MILSTGMYNITNEKDRGNAGGSAAGRIGRHRLHQAAIDSVFPGVGSAFIAIAVFFLPRLRRCKLSLRPYTDTNASYIMKNAGEKDQKRCRNAASRGYRRHRSFRRYQILHSGVEPG